ncbi:trypsin-like serine peptidase [Streptoverticillium reticulum]|uniref:trypsin-like serine peptidase n=1 Tax=Streptoverticillium reticulum TaxID=1433415 RepID=UPI0039BFE146
MRLNVRAPGPAGWTALAAAVLALAVIGLLVATRGLAATDAPVAEGDSAGHYREPAALGEASAQAMRSAVRTTVAREPVQPVSRGLRIEALPASEPLQAASMAPSPAVGPLFYTGQGDPDHGCTASVVHSPSGNLLITAAHCVHTGGFRTDLAFVPGYRDGEAPYGVWVPTAIDVAPQWTDSRDPDYDVAFVRVRSTEGDAQIERVTGAEQIRFDPPVHRPARVLGYPNGSEQPLGCQNTTTTEGPTQLRFDCEGLPNGTSGSPVLTDVDAATGLGTVNGVLGGKDEGGDDETSYSSYFGPAVEALYHRAANGSQPYTQ